MIGNCTSPEQFSARRGLLVACNAAAATGYSVVTIRNTGDHKPHDPFFIFLWFVWMLLTLVWVFGTPGYLRWSRAERKVINDELVKAHQSIAAKTGLTLAVASLGFLSLATLLHVPIPLWMSSALTSVTVVLTALWFAWLEHRDA